MVEAKLLEDPTYKVIGAAMRVHNVLGPGLEEAVYQKALSIEMEREGLSFEAERPVEIFVEGNSVGLLYLDHLVEGQLIVEEKAFSHLLTQEEIAQVITYLCASELKVGLLLNFGRRRLEYKRIFPPKDIERWHERVMRYVWTPKLSPSVNPLNESVVRPTVSVTSKGNESTSRVRGTDARLTFDLSRPGRVGCALPESDVPPSELPPPEFLRRDLNLPELSQGEVVRYFLSLSRLNYSVDTGFYPLGSCTMKYNPKVHEDLARLPGFAQAHPLQPEETAQGALALMYYLQRSLTEITGMEAASLAPAAGAQGELAGILMIKAYLADQGQAARRKVLVPDSVHGTNPATAAMAGYQVVTVASDQRGNTDLEALAAALDDHVAALMLTQPNTLGLFDTNVARIAQMLHEKGALLYGDGANLNAIVGRARLGDMGFDVVHLNLHKTFSTPHGGGGPGAGPVCVKAYLAPYLPTPVVERGEDGYRTARPARSIGRLQAFHGNFGVLLRAYAYIRSLGAQGLRETSSNAVLNANYVRARLKSAYHVPYDRRCMHEVVLSANRQRAKGVRAWDIAKRLIDYGFHPPTVYFPLTVDEAMLIEPTETESKEALDAFCDAMLAIAQEAEEEPELVKGAPYTAPVGRLDEAAAARRPVLRWQRGVD